MAPHSSTLAWKISWAEEPGRLQSIGLLRVGHDSTTSLSLFAFMHWRRKRQPTPVFLPGESQGRGSLVGCWLWGRTESDTTEATQQQQQQCFYQVSFRLLYSFLNFTSFKTYYKCAYYRAHISSITIKIIQLKNYSLGRKQNEHLCKSKGNKCRIFFFKIFFSC